MTWLLCDYGGVLSLEQPAADRATLAAAGGNADGFWHAYWKHRGAYDRADINAREYWERVTGASMTARTLDELIARDLESWLHGNVPVLDAVRRAGERGYRPAILSNAPAELADVLRHTPWLSAFQPRLFSCDFREVKPNPAVYVQALASLGAAPSEVIFFDDRAENVTAAAAVGIRAYRFVDAGQLDALETI